MAISLQDNLDIRNKKQNVERDSFKTIEEMRSFPSTSLPPVFHAMCEDDGCLYIYNVNNSENDTTGKWRKFECSTNGTGGTNGKDGVSPTVSITTTDTGHTVKITDVNGVNSFDVLNGKDGVNGTNGQDGTDGIGITKIEKTKTEGLVDTYTITFSDDSTFEYTVTNGTNGKDGVSPTITVTEIDDGHTITITDANGTQSFNVLNGKDGAGGTSGELTANDITYKNENFQDYKNVNLALGALFDKVYYIKPTCSLSASKKGGIFENGTVISAPVTFNWTINKPIKTQTLTDCIIADENVRTATYNTDISSDKTFTLTVGDGENEASSQIDYKFINKVFYGSSPIKDHYDSDFILSLPDQKLTTSIKSSYSMNVSDGEYGFIACPKSFNAPSECYIGGFLTTLDKIDNVEFTNSKGYTTTYIILKTGKPSLGLFTMEFR